jgi:negative regulator of sigma E activity
VSPLELVDDRYGRLAEELRAAKPVASPQLRERVRSLVPPPPRRFQLDLRRFVPAAGLAAAAAALTVAVVVGVVHGSSRPNASAAKSSESGVQGTGASRSTPPVPHGAVQSRSPAVPNAFSLDSAKALGLAPSTTRLQRYDAVLRVRVASQSELSQHTQDAIEFTRKAGGYLVWSAYSAPGKTGNSELVLRIPVEHVQAAIAHFTAYGALVKQQIVLKDVQQKVDALTATITKLHKDIARIEARLAGPLSASERIQLEQRLRTDKLQLTAATSRKAATVRRAQLAQVALALAVGSKPAGAPAGRFHRTIDDAASVLVRELELVLYALLVAGPLLLLGGAAILTGRALRRRSDRKLLESV